MNITRKGIISAKRSIEFESRGGGKFELRPSTDRIQRHEIGKRISTPAKKHRLPNPTPKPAYSLAPVKLSGEFKSGIDRNAPVADRCPAINRPTWAPVLPGVISARAQGEWL